MVRRVALVLLLLVLAPSGAALGATRGSTGDLAHDDGLQWGLDRIGAVDAWSAGRGDGVTIAVVDSGVQLDHEDLADNLVEGTACHNTGGDPEACTGSPTDEDGHGTHVAGVAAAVAGNRTGIAGVAPDARIMPVKVLHTRCDACPTSGSAPDVVAAIRWAAGRGADIINLSLGSTTSTVFGADFVAAISEAWDDGAIPVVAAGNQYVLTADFGDAPAVVVSAVTREDAAPSYSNGIGNARWALAAPGGESGDTAQTCSRSGVPLGILSTYHEPGKGDAYACLSGTSMAAPHVSGALAVLLSAGLDRDRAISTLLSSAEDIGEPGPDDMFGAGLLDLEAAVNSGVAPLDEGATPPQGEPTPPSDEPEEPDIVEPSPVAQPFVAETKPGGVPALLVVAALVSILGVTSAMMVLLRHERGPDLLS